MLIRATTVAGVFMLVGAAMSTVSASAIGKPGVTTGLRRKTASRREWLRNALAIVVEKRTGETKKLVGPSDVQAAGTPVSNYCVQPAQFGDCERFEPVQPVVPEPPP